MSTCDKLLHYIDPGDPLLPSEKGLKRFKNGFSRGLHVFFNYIVSEFG